MKKTSVPRLLQGSVVALAFVSMLGCTLMYQYPTARARSRSFSHGLFFRGAPSAHSLAANVPDGSGFRQLYSSLAQRHSHDQQLVVNMTRHAWSGYREFANWTDFLDVNAISGGRVYSHDMALTVVDSLDTLFIMGLHDEFDEASAWLKANLESVMIQTGYVSFFEITIRALGGLLSAFYLSGESHFLELSTTLGDALSKAFKCGGFAPCRSVDLKTGESTTTPFLSEANTFQLEFAYLARASGNQAFLDPVININNAMIDMVDSHYPDSILPVAIDWYNVRGAGSFKTMGALGDSYYEYLLKQWLLSGKKDDSLRQMYVTAVDGMKMELLARSSPSGMLFVGETSANQPLIPKMEHLTCFVPGMLALGVLRGMPREHLFIAKELTETCVQMCMQSSTGLAPEAVQFTTQYDGAEVETMRHLDEENNAAKDMFVTEGDDYNMLRPETVESLMILYRATGDEIYREHGRRILQAIETYSKLPTGGYRSLRRVFNGPGTQTYSRVMESFFIAETLKYLFLLFSDANVLPLDEVVFNTEAHPFPVAI